MLLDPDPGGAGGQGGGGGGAAGGAGGAGGGATARYNWRDHIPPEFKASPSLATIKDVPDLIKGFVNAQSLIGMKRIALPPENASEAQMAEFFAAIGRPETVDKYSAATVKPAEGMTFDENGLKEARTLFHSIGLTDKQQQKIMDFYISGMNKTHAAMAQSLEAGKHKAENTLRQEWGNSYNANLGLVQEVIRHYGDEALAQELSTAIGNNVGLTRMLLKFGKTLSEDSNPKNKLQIREGTPAAAQQRIAELKQDKEFMRALDDKKDPGHEAAVETWTAVHRQLGGSQTVQ